MTGILPLKGRTLKVLSKDEIYDIHLATLQILERPGIMVKNEKGLKILDDAGADVNYKNKTARFPSYLVQEMISKAPPYITLCGRNSKYDVLIGDRHVHYTNGYGSINIIDLETAGSRPLTCADLEDLIRICDSLKNVHVMISQGVPQDVPSSVSDRYTNLIMLSNTEKNCMVTSFDAEGSKDAIKMGVTIMGSEDELRKRPIIFGVSCPSSPLQYDEHVIDSILEFCKIPIPILNCAIPMASGTAPASLAGTLTLQNAEILSGLVIIQLVQPGTPFIYGTLATIMDQKYGSFVAGGPEIALLNAATSQLCQYYNLPFGYATSGITDSKISDIQAGYEKALSTLFVALSGADMIHDAVSGLVESVLTSSMEQLIIDNEICNMINRHLEGINVTDETLAVDVIREIGPGGNFIDHDHTNKYFRLEDWFPKISDRTTRREWEIAGGKNLVAVAKEEAKKILSSHYPTPLDKDVQKSLEGIVKESEQKTTKH